MAFDVRQDSLVQDLESLVGADLNLEALVQTVVEGWGLDDDLELHAPGFLLSIGAFWIEGTSQVARVFVVVINVVTVVVTHLVEHVLRHLVVHI